MLDYGDDKELKSALKLRSQKKEGLRGQYCQSFNRTFKSGHNFDSMDSKRLVKISTKQSSLDTVSHKSDEDGEGVHWDEEAKRPLQAFWARLLGFFGRLLSFIEDNSTSLRKRKSRFISSSSELWCKALFFNNSESSGVFDEMKSLTRLNTLMLRSVSKIFKASKMYGVRKRWQ